MSEERAEYRVEGRTELRRETRVPFADPNYLPPTSDEIREVVRQLGLTGSQVADLVGVRNHRKMREYIGGQREISYAAWRLLLLDAGLALGGSVDVPQRMVADRELPIG